MADNIVLSKGIRQNLLTLQRTSDNLGVIQNRLATGLKVNSALDDPQAFFVAQGLRSRGSDLSSLLDSMGLAVQTLKAADNGIKGITKLVETAQGLTRQALQTTDTTVRATLATQFDAIMTQIANLAEDSGYNGTNLLNNQNLTVTLNETASNTLVLTGVNYNTATPLSIAAAAGSWATDANVNAAVANLATATTTLRSQASTFGANLTVLQARQDFAKEAILALNAGADLLTLADQNEEGAKLLALGTRQQLGTQALSLANQSDQAILRLFGG
jgi:flagellin